MEIPLIKFVGKVCKKLITADYALFNTSELKDVAEVKLILKSFCNRAFEKAKCEAVTGRQEYRNIITFYI